MCVVHHPRKSDGGEGTGTRGSGALVGFVDVAMELRRAPKSTDPHGRRRALREGREDDRKDELRTTILAVLPHDDPDGMTREEIWDALPDAVRKNNIRFRIILEAECGRLWRKVGAGNKAGAYRYRRNEIVTHPGEEEGFFQQTLFPAQSSVRSE